MQNQPQPAVKETKETAQGFLGSVFKFSISTYVNFIIYGVTLLFIGRLIPDDVYGPVSLFITYSTLVMNIAILGLDQSFIRFFNEPPNGISTKSLFGVCYSLASGAMLLLSFVGSVFLPAFLMNIIGLSFDFNYLPLLFLNAFFLMISRFYNVAYRMEQNIPMFTLQSILSQFFSKLFYLVGFFFPNPKNGMLYAAVLGMALFSLFFTFLRRKKILPQKNAFSTPVLKTVLPYGIALAPSAVLIYLNSAFSSSFIGRTLGDSSLGLFTYAATLSNVVTVIQGGFATFWGAYMFANYKTQQKRIMQVHNYLNLLILCFFTCIVMFQDILFWLLPMYAAAKYIFPVIMLSAVFTILGEGTVYGIQIARKPIFDTIGIGLSLVVNVVLCILLVPRLDILGAALALAISSFVMFAFRTVVAQRFYRTIEHPTKTLAALVTCMITACFGYIFANDFWPKALVCLAALGVYCLLYKQELIRCIQLGIGFLKGLPTMLKKEKNNK